MQRSTTRKPLLPLKQVAGLADLFREQESLLKLLEDLLEEHRQALVSRRPEQVEAAILRLETLALRFRILEDARRDLVAGMGQAAGLPAGYTMEDLIQEAASADLSASFERMRRAAGRVVRAGAIHTRFVQRSLETGEGLRRLFDWAAGGSYTAEGEMGKAPDPRSSWESCA
ncbi:MAG: flagellar export chaperone FlgN [Acidobacteriota bacterium]